MTAKEAKLKFNGMQYDDNIPQKIIEEIKESCLVVVYVNEYSETVFLGQFTGNYLFDVRKDGVEISKNIGIHLNQSRVVSTIIPVDLIGYEIPEKSTFSLRIIENRNKSPYWRMEIDIPHETFHVVCPSDVDEGNEIWCEGVIFEAWRLPE